MSNIANVLADAIIDTMKASSDFNTLFFIQGVALNVPVQYYPNAEVHIASSRTVRAHTGNWYEKVYTGEVRFYDRYQDRLEFVDRVAVIASTSAVSAWVRLFTRLFEQTANKDLQDLDDTDFKVTNVLMGDISYGWEQRDQRSNNWDNYGAVRFEVYTIEVNT